MTVADQAEKHGLNPGILRKEERLKRTRTVTDNYTARRMDARSVPITLGRK